MESQVSADKEYNDLIKPIMLSGKFICVWPLEKDRPIHKKLLHICHLFWLLFVLLSMCVTVTTDTILHFDDLVEFTECALWSSVFYLTIVRLIIFMTHQKDMAYVVETMRKDWICSSYEDRVVLKEKCHFAFRLSKIFISMVYGTVICFSCLPILEIFIQGGQRILPFHGYFFINQTVSPVYECIYVFNVMGGFFAGGTICGATSFSLMATIHGSAKFVVLQKKLEAITSNDPHVDRAMANCVKRHQDAIAFADALERIINVLALAQFVISTGLVCFAGFQITSMIQNKALLMEYGMFLQAAVLELFMFSFSGNALIEESDAVGESAYRSGWIGGTFGRSLQIVIMRSKVPSRITAAKFYSMSLETFSRVLSTSFSYITVLMAAKEE
ncbi:hypothetical protein P5V15_012529 [Pogonomyrmex californicus]